MVLRAVVDESIDAAHWEAVEEAAELLQEEQVQEALVVLRDVIKASPSNPYAYNLLGHALYELGQLEPARDAYRAAVRLAPSFLGARVALSHALRRLGDTDGAIAQAKEALRRFPKDGEAMHAMGLSYAARGNRALARKHLQGFLDAGPEVEAAMEVRQILEMLGVGGDDEPLQFE
ncbi:tetratricopeptide repeat protein [Sorangium sp. So ce281]|uniref:tetratricopeptide repeat protein n=1 Tax=unclassified Sorangium TaxID=2621164 RepID=UPI003F61216C